MELNPSFNVSKHNSMSAEMASQTRLSPVPPLVGRLTPCQRQERDCRRESKASSSVQEHGAFRACASSRPEHARSNNTPTYTGQQFDQPNACGFPGGSPSSRAVLPPLTPEAQSPNGNKGGNGLALLDYQLSTAGGAKKQFSFFDFPPEIRNMIYHCSLYWPDCADLYRSYYRQAATQPRNMRCHRAHLRTPTILLLCRRITDESMPVLKSRWFIIDRLPPCMPPLADGSGGFLRMSNFIGRETLQRLHFIDLRIGLGEGPMGSGWVWSRVLDELLVILSERNAFVHFRLLIRRCNQDDSPMIWTTEIREDLQIRKVCLYFFISLVYNTGSHLAD